VRTYLRTVAGVAPTFAPPRRTMRFPVDRRTAEPRTGRARRPDRALADRPAAPVRAQSAHPPCNVDYANTPKDKLRGKHRPILNGNLGRGFETFLLDACANILSVTKGAVYVCMSSSELHTLQRAFAAAGGKWSTFIIWAKNTFTITSSVAIVNDTTWSTIVGTWRPGRLELYVDGWSRASSTAAATSTSALFGIYRWGWGFSTSQDFNGDIALIACFASSWTPAMVRRWHADPFGFLRPWGEVPALMGSAPPSTPPSTGTGVVTFVMG
jgi:Concanavalin A-like lectin/glucanases superfamily